MVITGSGEGVCIEVLLKEELYLDLESLKQLF